MLNKLFKISVIVLTVVLALAFLTSILNQILFYKWLKKQDNVDGKKILKYFIPRKFKLKKPT